jgi:hypothetical protein
LLDDLVLDSLCDNGIKLSIRLNLLVYLNGGRDFLIRESLYTAASPAADNLVEDRELRGEVDPGFMLWADTVAWA